MAILWLFCILAKLDKKTKGDNQIDYRQMIIDIVNEINNSKMLEYIYGLMQGIIKEWG